MHVINKCFNYQSSTTMFGRSSAAEYIFVLLFVVRRQLHLWEAERVVIHRLKFVPELKETGWKHSHLSKATCRNISEDPKSVSKEKPGPVLALKTAQKNPFFATLYWESVNRAAQRSESFFACSLTFQTKIWQSTADQLPSATTSQSRCWVWN